MKTDKLNLTHALDWANRQLKECPHLSHVQVVDEAAVKFDLGPMDEDWLLNELSKPLPPS
jgi:hypothetical protein